MSTPTAVVCAKAALALRRLNKPVVALCDVREALQTLGIHSTAGLLKYTECNGHLTRLGYLDRCTGGWEIAPDRPVTISIKANERIAGKVFRSIAGSIQPYRGLVTAEIEV